MPDLIMDRHHPEDVETDNQEDHVYDSVRYFCMSRSWIAPQNKPAPVQDRWLRMEPEETENWKTA